MSNTVGNKTFKGGAAYDAVGKHKVDLVKRASALKFLANAMALTVARQNIEGLVTSDCERLSSFPVE